jgi:hypothetical protein
MPRPGADHGYQADPLRERHPVSPAQDWLTGAGGYPRDRSIVTVTRLLSAQLWPSL